MKHLFVYLFYISFIIFVSASSINFKKRDVTQVTQVTLYVTRTSALTVSRKNRIAFTDTTVSTATSTTSTTTAMADTMATTAIHSSNTLSRRTYRTIKKQPKSTYVTTSTTEKDIKQTQPPTDGENYGYGSEIDSYGTISSSDAQKLLSLVNSLRAQKGLKILKMDSNLTAAALAQCEYQASFGSMTHTNTNFVSLADRFAASGANCLGNCAENVAKYYGSVQSVFDAWIKSPGHLANILGSSYTSMGIAFYNGFWTQTFNSQLILE